jgi:Asp-tRNA(Asn)/Glu-tRNA(Gln) amidotransferase A subunit family amidase
MVVAEAPLETTSTKERVNGAPHEDGDDERGRRGPGGSSGGAAASIASSVERNVIGLVIACSIIAG